MDLKAFGKVFAGGGGRDKRANSFQLSVKKIQFGIMTIGERDSSLHFILLRMTKRGEDKTQLRTLIRRLEIQKA
jgi:hypothetical protein